MRPARPLTDKEQDTIYFGFRSVVEEALGMLGKPGEQVEKVDTVHYSYACGDMMVVSLRVQMTDQAPVECPNCQHSTFDAPYCVWCGTKLSKDDVEQES